MRQLETFIHAHNLTVPPTDTEHQAVLDQLSSLYPRETSERNYADRNHTETVLAIPQVFPDLGLGVPTAPAVDMTSTTDLSGVPDLLPTSSSFLQTALQAPDHAADGHSNMSPLDFSAATLPFNQYFDVDWVWNHTMVNYLDGDIDVDHLQLPVQTDDKPLSQADPQSTSSDPSPPTLPNDDELTDDEDQSAVTNELSHRLGSLLMTDNGERHFYGATSNLNLARGGNLPVMYGNRPDQGRQAHARLEVAGIHQDISRDLEEHLLQLFFTWHNPTLYVVDQALFTKARMDFEQGKRETVFYSPFLLNAMYDTSRISQDSNRS